MNEKTYRILLVDDDKFLLDMYALKFRSAGFTVVACNSGEMAIDKLKSEDPFDIILMDIIMPGKDGFETLGAVQKEHLAKGAKIVMLSNQGKDDNIEEARSLGATGYIVKASSIPSEVLARVKETLGIESNGTGKKRS
jgi:DNA-binding response OmpR family regulator